MCYTGKKYISCGVSRKTLPTANRSDPVSQLQSPIEARIVMENGNKLRLDVDVIVNNKMTQNERKYSIEKAKGWAEKMVSFRS